MNGLEMTPMHDFSTRKGEQLQFGYPSVEHTTEFSLATECFYYEALRYEGSGGRLDTNVKGELDHDSLRPWLEKDVSTHPSLQGAEPKDEALKGGIRLLFGSCSFNSKTQCRVLPFLESDFSLISTHLQLPASFFPTFRAWIDNAYSTTCDPSPTTIFTPSKCYVFKISIVDGGQFILATSHSPHQSLTTALLLHKTKTPLQHPTTTFSTLLSLLTPSHSPLTHHPLHLPLILLESSIEASVHRLQWADSLIDIAEHKTGQHAWIDKPIGDPLDLDFTQETRTLNFIRRCLALEGMRFRWLVLGCEAVLRYLAELEGMGGSGEGEGEGGSRGLREWVARLENGCRGHLLRVEFQEKKVQALIAVVYQFMAQKDSKINIRLAETTALIAREGKKDSGAMKAIAVLTMCFLPGTFLAAVFAMPLFNWDGGDQPVIKKGFTIYWAIAVPLTLVVLLVWSATMLVPWRWGASSGEAEIGSKKERRQDLETGDGN